MSNKVPSQAMPRSPPHTHTHKHTHKHKEMDNHTEISSGITLPPSFPFLVGTLFPLTLKQAKGTRSTKSLGMKRKVHLRTQCHYQNLLTPMNLSILCPDSWRNERQGLWQGVTWLRVTTLQQCPTLKLKKETEMLVLLGPLAFWVF